MRKVPPRNPKPISLRILNIVLSRRLIMKSSDSVSPTSNAVRSGVTLLELMIVLVILAGALAIAWPSLQRPLNRVRLDEASQTIREAIDESRQKAISCNKSMLIRLRKGDHEVQTGSIESFAEEIENGGTRAMSSLSDSRTSASTGSSSNPKAIEPQIWKLPDDVVVVNVESGEPTQSSQDLALSSDRSSSDPEREPPSIESREGDSSDGTDRSTSDLDEVPSAEESQTEWWVPLDAQGIGMDAKITLKDKVTNKSIYVSYSAATGSLEISR
jgi:prepilin-type N-terminal cleavage/methylation domain-containing protein